MSSFDLGAAGFDTAAIHAGYRRDSDYGALASPIYQTSTFTFRDTDTAFRVVGGLEPGFDYTRAGNPTVRVFEEKIAFLEGGEDAVATASGNGALSSVILGLFRSGDHIVCSSTIYGCTDVIMREILPTLGFSVSFVDTSDTEEIEEAINERTAAIFFETPANPTMRITDIAAVAGLKKKHPGIRVIVDNTFAPPPVQYPLKLGADIVVHSATKYLNGHGDVIGGVAVGSRADMAPVRSRAMGKITGSPMSPFSAYMIIRGMKTLGLRVRRHCESAMKIAEYLEGSPFVGKVYYPGLRSMGKAHEVASRQMNGLYTGMISFVVRDGINGLTALEAAKKLMDSVRIPAIAVSLGDPDTLIEHPAAMTHASVPEEARLASGITDGMLRYSVGLEDPEDLIADLEQAFAAL